MDVANERVAEKRAIALLLMATHRAYLLDKFGSGNDTPENRRDPGRVRRARRPLAAAAREVNLEPRTNPRGGRLSVMVVFSRV